MRKRRLKYGNKRVEYDGIKFDSKVEMERYKVLKRFEEAGLIEGLVCHPRFPFEMDDGRRVVIRSEHRNTLARYTADFEYYKLPGRVRVVEDVKNPYTAKEGGFKLRRAVFEMIYGLELRIVFDPHAEV